MTKPSYELSAFSVEELGVLKNDLYNLYFFLLDFARPLVNQGSRRLNRLALILLSRKHLS